MLKWIAITSVALLVGVRPALADEVINHQRHVLFRLLY